MSGVAKADSVHLGWIIGSMRVHRPSSYFSTLFKYWVPSNPPIAYIPSGKDTAANALLGIFNGPQWPHFPDVNTSTVFKHVLTKF